VSTAWPDMDGRPPHQVIADRLAQYLGPHTARVALKTFAERIGLRSPEALTRAQVPELLAALRPMLHTLIGRERTEGLVLQLARELG
jgi:hypothetical protein